MLPTPFAGVPRDPAPLQVTESSRSYHKARTRQLAGRSHLPLLPPPHKTDRRPRLSADTKLQRSRASPGPLQFQDHSPQIVCHLQCCRAPSTQYAVDKRLARWCEESPLLGSDLMVFGPIRPTQASLRPREPRVTAAAGRRDRASPAGLRSIFWRIPGDLNRCSPSKPFPNARRLVEPRLPPRIQVVQLVAAATRLSTVNDPSTLSTPKGPYSRMISPLIVSCFPPSSWNWSGITSRRESRRASHPTASSPRPYDCTFLLPQRVERPLYGALARSKRQRQGRARP